MDWTTYINIEPHLKSMERKEIIEEFLEEWFQNTSRFFLYKDKQLLKTGKYREYSREQIRKANRIFRSVLFGAFMTSFYGITSFIRYGEEPNGLDLFLGVGSWVALIAILLFSAKEYYIIKGSMTLLMKLTDQEEITPFDT